MKATSCTPRIIRRRPISSTKPAPSTTPGIAPITPSMTLTWGRTDPSTSLSVQATAASKKSPTTVLSSGSTTTRKIAATPPTTSHSYPTVTSSSLCRRSNHTSKPLWQDATPTPPATNSTRTCSSKSTRPDLRVATSSGNGTSGTTSSRISTPSKAITAM